MARQQQIEDGDLAASVERRQPAPARASDARKRARKLQASPKWDVELTRLVATEAAHLANLRARATGFQWDVDHMIPLLCKTACGLHTWANLQVIPHDMNLRKFNRLELTQPGEWIHRL